MADNRRGLGRGLSALLGDANDGASGAIEGVREVPVELIRRNPSQPRQVFLEPELEELAESIRNSGILQPILVRPAGGNEFEIVAGERRWRAAQKAGLRTIPVLVRELGDDQAFEIAVVENVQRADLNALEEARAYSALMGRMAYTQDAVSNAVGKSRSHVANTLRLLQLPGPVQDLVLEGKLSAGHARAILTASDPVWLAETVVARGLSVREAESLAKRGPAQSKKGSGPRRAAKDPNTAALEADLEDVLGMPVELIDRDGSGEVRIRYASLDQLDEIIRRLGRR
jgi:ParB family chromosome partitioning protein